MENSKQSKSEKNYTEVYNLQNKEKVKKIFKEGTGGNVLSTEDKNKNHYDISLETMPVVNSVKYLLVRFKRF